MFAPTSHRQAAEAELHQRLHVDAALAIIAILGILATGLASVIGSSGALVLLPV
jgi:hypothetical protein